MNLPNVWDFFSSRRTIPAIVPEEKKRHFTEEGWVVLEQVLDSDLVDAVSKDIAEFRAENDDGKDEYGHGKRIGLLHVALPRSLQAALNQKSQNFLRWYFGDEPVLFGTLTFEVGTEQNPHHDAAFFNTDPEDAMVGVWIALEDISHDSGPLFYIPRSHRFPRLKADEVLAQNENLQARVREFRKSGKRALESKELADEVYAAWDLELQRNLQSMGAAKIPALLKKGDAFIWHGWLIHGGLPRQDKRLTRRSMVCHFISRSSRMWDQYDFFLNGSRLGAVQPIKFNYVSCKWGTYTKHANPVLFPTGNAFYKA